MNVCIITTRKQLLGYHSAMVAGCGGETSNIAEFGRVMAGVAGAMTDGINGIDGRDGTKGRTGMAGLGQILIVGGKANLRSGLKIRPHSLYV